MLRNGQERRHATPIQVLQQLVEMQDEVLLFRHRCLVTIDAVDRDHSRVGAIHAGAHAVREFAGRQFRGVHLLDSELARIPHGFQIDAQPFRPAEEESQLLIECEQCGALSPFHGSGEVLQNENGFSRPRRSDNKRARSR